MSQPQSKNQSLIRRSSDPDVRETPFDELSFCTPSDLFYVRNHFPTPTIDSLTWRLCVDGLVTKKLELNYDDLAVMPQETITVTLECAGNNRIFLSPPVRGVQWELGGVSTATWTGVCLSRVLAAAGLNPDTVDIVFEGADQGEPDVEPKPHGAIHFARSLPAARAMQDDVLLALKMNGEDLSPEHGYPLRLIVPGWYAVASVKWLQRITASPRAFHGYYQSTDYAYWDKSDGEPVRKPISQMLVKSLVSRPERQEVIPAGHDYVIGGVAWSGTGNIERVEVSTDGGVTWQCATLTGERQPNAWIFWRFNWRTPSSPGTVTLMSRATDDAGNQQGVSHDADREGYMINFCFPVPVVVA